MAKNYHFFPFSKDVSKAMLLTDNNVLLTTVPELKIVFNKELTIDAGSANMIRETVEDGEIPHIMD